MWSIDSLRNVWFIGSGMVFLILLALFLSYKNRLCKAEKELAAMKTKGIPISPKPQITLKGTQKECNTIEEENTTLFRKLDLIVTTKQLFTRQDISRDDLMKCIGVDKNRLARILQQNAYTNVTGYLNDKRLEYAVELLRAHPEYNIVTVANMCGTSISSFNRIFKSKYKMTPNDFKHLL